MPDNGPPSRAPPMTVTHDTPTLDHLLDFSGKTQYGDFRDDLIRDGYCVIKNVLSKEKAGEIVSDIHEWLESFNLGYKRDDPSTIREECLPVIHQKGLIQAYGAPHESFTWKVRGDPSVIGIFEKLYQTEDLLSSFDAVNVSLPRRDLPPNDAWAHQDQDPERPGFRCVQGFVNLLPCGDDDGGLVVLKGGHLASEEYHEAFRNEETSFFRWTNEIYVFKDTGLAWLRERGLEFVKVNAGPGDMVLWDSRSAHYNKSPKQDTARMVVYTCYAPVFTATKEDLLTKKRLFEQQKGHTHWPQGLNPFIEEVLAPKRNGVIDPLNTWKPRQPPVLSERAFKLTGIPYLQAQA